MVSSNLALLYLKLNETKEMERKKKAKRAFNWKTHIPGVNHPSAAAATKPVRRSSEHTHVHTVLYHYIPSIIVHSLFGVGLTVSALSVLAQLAICT